MRRPSDVDLSAWAIGVLLVVIGVGIKWGWSASLIVLGVYLSGWTMAKQFRPKWKP